MEEAPDSRIEYQTSRGGVKVSGSLKKRKYMYMLSSEDKSLHHLIISFYTVISTRFI